MFATEFKFAIGIWLVCQGLSLAQESRSDTTAGEFYRPVVPLPPDFYFTQHHASTAAEGWMRGQAALRHADGSYWLSLSQAHSCREQARCLALENRQRWLEHRARLRGWREGDRQRRLSERRVANEARRPARSSVYTLRREEFDRATGRIEWPDVLQAIEHKPLRENTDRLYRVRVARYDAVEVESELRHCIDKLIRELQRRIGQVDRAEYLAAHRFLRGLKLECEQLAKAS